MTTMPGGKIPKEVQLALGELGEYLGEIYGERLRGLYLYGSYARGDFHPGSDVDVLILLEGNVLPTLEIDRIGDGVADICLKHNVLLATFPVPESWLQERKSPLFETVRREGIRL
jgi:predicted nucleotidyltransferase